MAPTRKGPGEGEGEPGRATGRIGVGTSPDAGCRASRPAAAVSVRASKLPSVVRLQQSLRRPAVPPCPVVLRLGHVLSQRASVLPFCPPSHCPAAPLEKSRSSALPTPHSARRRAGQAAGGSTHHLPRQMSRLLVCTQSAGRRTGGRRTRHRAAHPRRSPPRAELSLLARSPSGTPPSFPSRPRLFPPGLTPRTSDRSPWYPPHPPVFLAPAGWRPLLRPEALHRSGAPRRTRLGRWTGCQGSAGRVGH